MTYVIVLVLFVGIVLLVGMPVLRAHPQREAGAIDETTELERSELRTDLEAARDAKYREIRDAELDHQTGKLSDSDHAAIDATLRADAIELLRQLDDLGGGERLPSSPE